MLRKARKLLGHPAFQAQPFRVIVRCVLWSLCAAIGYSPVFRLTSAGERLRVPADLRYTSVTAFLLRDWIEPELRHLWRFLSPGDVFIDVGANIGVFTLKAARLVGPRGRVIAVEPGAVSANLLARNLALNSFPYVTLVQRALSDLRGTAQLYHNRLGDDPQAFSLLRDGSSDVAEVVQTSSLDDLIAELSMSRLDCVKMDVEGAEPMIVTGGRQTLERFHPIVIFEINSAPADGSVIDVRCFAQLEALGYRMYELTGKGFISIDVQPPDHRNLIAIHPKGKHPIGLPK